MLLLPDSTLTSLLSSLRFTCVLQISERRFTLTSLVDYMLIQNESGSYTLLI